MLPQLAGDRNNGAGMLLDSIFSLDNYINMEMEQAFLQESPPVAPANEEQVTRVVDGMLYTVIELEPVKPETVYKRDNIKLPCIGDKPMTAVQFPTYSSDWGSQTSHGRVASRGPSGNTRKY